MKKWKKKMQKARGKTSMLAVTATTGEHGGESVSPLRVASGHIFSAVVKAPNGGSIKGQIEKMTRTDAVADSDSDLDSVKTITSKDELELLMWEQAQTELSNEDKERFKWATGAIAEGRVHFSKNPKYAAKDHGFSNCIEKAVIKSLEGKRQRSVDESPFVANSKETKKRKRNHEDVRPSTSKTFAKGFDSQRSGQTSTERGTFRHEQPLWPNGHRALEDS